MFFLMGFVVSAGRIGVYVLFTPKIRKMNFSSNQLHLCNSFALFALKNV